MIIENLYAKDLHGYITGGTILKPGLNIIYGKNGSGKTTALNIIRAILNLDVDYIKSLEFSSISIGFLENEKKGVISFDKIGDGYTVKLNNLSAPFSSIVALVKGDQENALILKSFMEDFSKELKKSKPLDDAIAIKKEFDRIKSHTSITLVNIDRTIKVTDHKGDIALDNAWQLNLFTQKPAAEKTPLDYVQSYCIENQRELNRKLASIKTEFINGLMVKFLDLRVNELERDQVNVTIEDISRLEQRLRELDIYKDQGPAKVLVKFFKETKKIFEAQSSNVQKKPRVGRRSANEEKDIIVRNISFGRIESLLTSIQEMDAKIEESSARTKKYLEVVNTFFTDSGKEILFSKIDGQLRFKFLASDESMAKERGVNELSSGERQIIIVLSYLHFVAKKQSIFIIDEPELSLHLAWQKQFVNAMLKLAPENCQIILASHSPEIVGPYRNTVSRVFGDSRGQ